MRKVLGIVVFGPLLCLSSASCMINPGDSDGMQEVTLKFAAVVGEEAAACGRMYEGLGTAGTTAEILDLRFYVSNIRLITDEGDEVPLELAQDGKWQVENVALLDFENGTGNCADAGTTDINTEVRGMAPDGHYHGVVFDVAVPFDLNHDDLAAAPAPLNVSAMFWAWAIGHKFIRVDMQTDEGLRWNMHLGSTMCESGGPTDPPVTACARPNVPTIVLDDFHADDDTIVFDIAELFATSDLTQDTPDTASGCQSFPNDEHDCVNLFPNLGLDFEMGKCVDDCNAQRVFRAAEDAPAAEDAAAAIARGQMAFAMTREAMNGSMVACANCHGADGSGGVGPDIRSSGATHLLQHAHGDAPHAEGIKFADLTEADAVDIAAYLASICEEDPDCDPGSVDDHDHHDGDEEDHE